MILLKWQITCILFNIQIKFLYISNILNIALTRIHMTLTYLPLSIKLKFKFPYTSSLLNKPKENQMYIGDANFLYTMKCFLCALPGNNGWKQYRIIHSRVSKCFPETLSIGMLHRLNWPLPLHHIWSCHAVYILLLSSFKRIYIQCEKFNNAFTAVWKHVDFLRNLGNDYPILMLLYLFKSSWSPYI